jgi:hypothetical protein
MLSANYDVSGKIRSVTWSNAPRGVSLMLTPRPGEFFAEIEGHSLTDRVPTEQELRELIGRHRISNPIQRTALTKRS